jgi:ABC-type antimicrobial peptide transport system ATPase subunit
VKLERENLVKDRLLDWRFKETELKKLRRRRRRLFGKELLMSFSNSQHFVYFLFFLDLDLAERCREREEGE